MAQKGKRKKTGKKQPRKKSIKAKKGLPVNRLWLAVAIIAAVTFIAYIPNLSNGFVDIDDQKLILGKERIFLHKPHRILDRDFGGVHYKPMTYFTWMLEYRAVGAKPFLYHFDNVLLHIINSILVFFLALQLAPKFNKLKEHAWMFALFSGLIFGVHPMHAESVSWIVERKDVLFTCFYLLGLLGYIRYLNSGKILPLALSAVAYLASVMSKSPGITMIAVLFLMDFIWKRKLSAKLFYEKAAHFGVLAFTLYAFGIFKKGKSEGRIGSLAEEQILAKAENVKETHTLYGKVVLASMRGWLWYIHSLLPFRLSLGYPREAIISFFGPLIHVFPVLLAGAAGALVWFREKNRLLFVGHVFFFLTLFPALSRLGLGIGIFMSDRYIYLAVLGLILWLVGSTLRMKERGVVNERFKLALLSAVVLLFTVLTFQATKVWKGTESLWTNVIEKYPSVPYAHINRASYYRDLGDFEKALQDANAGVELDDNANARIQRGLILRQSGQARQAIADYTRAIELEPKNTQAYTNRGNAYLDMGQFQKAIKDFKFVLKRGRNAKASMNMAIAYAQLGQFAESEKAFNQSQRIHPSNPDLYINRAIMFFSSGQYQKALNDYEAYLRLQPDDHQIWNDAGIVYQRLGNHQKAIEYFGRAISIYPFKDYYNSRARSYDAVGNASAAQQDRANAARQ